jgi:hypothetical protein
MAINGQGWELHIVRLGMHRFEGRTRTYGSYQAFLNGAPIDGLTGYVCESPGPGENEIADTGKRIEQGRYPLYTQFGENYRTIDYSSNVTIVGGEAPIPMPGILVGNTGNRTAILIHPGHPPDLYLSSIGCLNLTHTLGSADELNFLESRSRVIAMIDALKAYAPAAFNQPNSTNLGAWIAIDGEPMNFSAPEVAQD